MSSEVSAPKLSEAVKSDKYASQNQFEDCTPCRLIGTAAFTGLGVYTWFSGNAQLRQNRVEILKKGGAFSYQLRRGGIGATAAGLIALGFYRLVTP